MNNDYQSLQPELRENLKMMAESQPCQTVEEVRALLEYNDKGRSEEAAHTVSPSRVPARESWTRVPRNVAMSSPPF